jgi:tetratricopeptide (TPR) repeat protein
MNDDANELVQRLEAAMLKNAEYLKKHAISPGLDILTEEMEHPDAIGGVGSARQRAELMFAQTLEQTEKELKRAALLIVDDDEMDTILRDKVDPEGGIGVLEDPESYAERLKKGESLASILKIPPEFIHRLFEMGSDAFRTASYDDAASLFLYLCFLHPTLYEGWFSLGLSLQKQQKFKEAYLNYTTSLFFDSQKLAPYLNMADCMIGLREEEKAVGVLQLIDELELPDEMKAQWDQRVFQFKQRRGLVA